MATENLFKKLKQENQFRVLFHPLLVMLGIFTLSLTAAFIAALLISPIYSFDVACKIIAGGLIIGGILFLALVLRKRENLNKTAQSLDRNFNLKNRLEASVELEQLEDHPLKTAQQTDASSFLEKCRLSAWSQLKLLLIALLLALLCIKASFIYSQMELPGHREIKPIEKSKEPEKKVPDFAELNLVEPEAETLAKPLDEIEWKGNGNSSRGFSKIVMDVFVNGKFIKSFPLEDEEQKLSTPGNHKLIGYIPLEEVDVVPYDLVSYNIKAFTTLNDKPDQEIISQPQFITIRPFREDAMIMRMGGKGSMPKKINILMRILRLQIMLNRATYAARIAKKPIAEPVIRENLQKLAKEQDNLCDDLDEFLEENSSEKITAEMLNHLKKTLTNMDNAESSLSEIYKKTETE